MREIELKVLERGQPTQLDYKALIQTIISTPANPQAGLLLDEVRRGVRVLNIVEKADGVLKLEDADHTYLEKKLKTFKFAKAHKNIIEFADDIKNAKEVKT